ncbi:MAG: peptidoglycan editing factor PgeF [Bacilli bacterium]|jgi:YfiH family protein|nr:peptidoglycan editing factor PgeF [Bacilli bacterium]
MIDYNIKDVIAITTTREDGYSQGVYAKNNMGFRCDDNAEHVKKNYEKLAKELKININDIYYPFQAHTDTLIKINKNDSLPTMECDALYTTDKDVYVGVLTADCLPILLYCSQPFICCAIHSGWKGSAKLITLKTINYLIKQEKLNPKNTTIILGPAINQKDYEVGKDVYDAINQYPEYQPQDCFKKINNNKYLYDNKQFNLNILKQFNFNKIINHNESTTNILKYYSYRQEGITGRLLSLIGKKANL